MDIIKVSGTSVPKSVAGAISAKLEESNAVDVQVIGANALNQAVKSIIVARNYCAKNDKALIVQPRFSKNQSDDMELVCITLRVFYADNVKEFAEC